MKGLGAGLGVCLGFRLALRGQGLSGQHLAKEKVVHIFGLSGQQCLM